MYEAHNKTRLSKWKVQAKYNTTTKTRGIDSLSFLGQPCLLTLVPSMIHWRFCNCIFPRVVFVGTLFSCGSVRPNVFQRFWLQTFTGNRSEEDMSRHFSLQRKLFLRFKKKGNVLGRCHHRGNFGCPLPEMIPKSPWNWKTLSNHPLVPSRHVARLARLEHPLLHLTRCGCAKLIGCFQDNSEFLSSVFVSQND